MNKVRSHKKNPIIILFAAAFPVRPSKPFVNVQRHLQCPVKKDFYHILIERIRCLLHVGYVKANTTMYQLMFGSFLLLNISKQINTQQNCAEGRQWHPIEQLS